MFRLFKKKEKVPQQDSQPALGAEELASYQSQLKEQLALENQHLEDAGYYEELGLLYDKLSDSDKAIEALEKSLSLKLSIDDGYKKLMALYNQKRKTAALAGDDQGIDYYMSKMDEMRNIAKKVTISGK